jgi:hypothetical protein
MRKTLGLIATVCLLLAACDELFYCGLDPSSTAAKPVFDFGKNEDFGGSAKVWAITISGTPLPDTCGSGLAWRTFWSIGLPTGERYRVLDKVEYGVLPDGFELTVPAETLPAGRIYDVHAGFHGLGTECYFRIVADSLGARTIQSLTEDEYLAIINPPGG